MSTLLHELLAGDDPEPSALDLDDAAFAQPEPPVLSVVAAQRLSAFDVEDNEANERARTLRRMLGLVMLALGSVMAIAGSVALGF